MKLCIENWDLSDDIQETIQSAGGELVNYRGSNVIVLVDLEIGGSVDRENKGDHPLYSYQFVYDSVSVGEIQDLEDYLLYSPLENIEKSPIRRHYSMEEERTMLEYIKSHSGNPNSRKYWAEAKALGLSLPHSVESLKYHWAYLPYKRIRADLKPRKKLNMEKKRHRENSQTLRRSPVNRNIQGDTDFLELSQRAECLQIPTEFEKLVEFSRRTSGISLTEQTVLKILMKNQGNSLNTIQFFESIKNN